MRWDPNSKRAWVVIMLEVSTSTFRAASPACLYRMESPFNVLVMAGAEKREEVGKSSRCYFFCAGGVVYRYSCMVPRFYVTHPRAR